MSAIIDRLYAAHRVEEVLYQSKEMLRKNPSHSALNAACVVRGYAELVWSGDLKWMVRLEIAISRMRGLCA